MKTKEQTVQHGRSNGTPAAFPSFSLNSIDNFQPNQLPVINCPLSISFDFQLSPGGRLNTKTSTHEITHTRDVRRLSYRAALPLFLSTPAGDRHPPRHCEPDCFTLRVRSDGSARSQRHGYVHYFASVAKQSVHRQIPCTSTKTAQVPRRHGAPQSAFHTAHIPAQANKNSKHQ
jgi:hypothetical protein